MYGDILQLVNLPVISLLTLTKPVAEFSLEAMVLALRTVRPSGRFSLLSTS